MKKLRPFLLFIILAIPVVALRARQDTPIPRLEITGVNSADMPTVIVTANVFDTLGQPMRGLVKEDFALIGELAGQAQITQVENISDDNLPFAAVLVIDVSSSMAELPLANAKAAARAFVESLGPEDEVAILAFGSQVRLAQDYTSNRASLVAAIEGLQARGETALYQAAYDGVQLTSENPRHTMILLSDGAEYGGESNVGRGAALEEAFLRGVPIYTIGVGYGFDRSYLQDLSESTNAHFYESPNADQLTRIYTELASLLRSQYVLTLDAPLPLDGTEYDLQLEVTTAQGSAQASAILRAPIPVPIVDLPALDEPISEPTDITAAIRADDPISSVTFSVDEHEPVALLAEPYTFSIDPVTYLPGEYLLSATASDDDDDLGTAVTPFTIAALPSQISLSPNLVRLGQISSPQTIAVLTEGQTPAASISVDFDGTVTELSAPTYTFVIDPLNFEPGENTVTVSVTNEGGITAEQDFDFTVAAVPPQVSIVGLQDGQSIDAPLEFSVNATAQEAITAITAAVGDLVLEANSDGSYTLDPLALQPGVNTLTVTATDSVRIGTARVNLLIAALPPRIIVDGLTEGETLNADRELRFNFVAQTPVIHVAVFVDGVDLAHLVEAPFGITLAVLDYEPGDHTLQITADTASDQQSTLTLPFSIALEPMATASAAAEVTLAAQAAGTQVANASETFVAQMAINATATQVAQSADAATATQRIVAATDAAAQAVLDTQATATDAARATELAQGLATLGAQMTATAAVEQITATLQAASAATENARATEVARETAAAESAQATQVSGETATAQATMRAGVAAQAQLATRDALATANALARAESQATQDARATRSVNSTATQVAELTAAVVLATERASNATATQDARNATVAAQQATRGSMDATATQLLVSFAATQTAQAAQNALNATATQIILEATAQQAFEVTATAAMQATRYLVATANSFVAATATEQKGVFNVTATNAAEASATQHSALTATAIAQATLDTRMTAVGPTATPLNGEAQSGGTPQPSPTLTEVQTDQPPADASANLVPILIVIVVIIVIVVVVLLMRRPNPPRR